MVSPRPGLKWLGPGVRISKGLQQAWNTTSDSVMTKMKEFIGQYPDAGIVTTGHSLGASSALLTALMLNHHFNVSVKVVGVGLPRLGNRKVCLVLPGI
jgi:predicted lipase